jgi:predicted ATP-binding protein involved in virulence
MQLEKIGVEGLFGRFSYSVALKRPEKITIIHAPNGFGKTVILTLINAFFSLKFEVFQKYNYSQFTLIFDNGERIEIKKVLEPDMFDKAAPQVVRAEPVVIITSNKSPGENYRVPLVSRNRRGGDLDEVFPFLDAVGPDAWLDNRTNEILTTAEAIRNYNAHLPPSMRGDPNPPQWLTQVVQSTECRLIETQRLLRLPKSSEPPRPARRHLANASAVVDMQARDLAERIGRNVVEYANAAQRLDQSFPKRLISARKRYTAPSTESITARSEEVSKKLGVLIDAGLLDRSGAQELLSPTELGDEEVRRVMGVYLDDMEDKLSKFDNLFARISLFRELITEKFQFKNVIISRDSGISVESEDGYQIFLTDLSSGEQHELVLLYELLFQIKDGALILIDEPELSLHVGWQIRFLTDLQRIQKLKPLQVLVATHSPQIINDRWDLTVELK